MRRWNLTLTAALIAVAAVHPGAAGPQTVPPQRGTPLPSTPFSNPDSSHDPFGRLFRVEPLPSPKSGGSQPLFPAEAKAFTPSLRKSRIVCGMVVTTVDGHLDPKFTREIPKDAPKGTMKVLPPPPCEYEK